MSAPITVSHLLEECRRKDLQIKDLTEALQFYANKENYVQHPVGYELASDVDLDGGFKARAVLTSPAPFFPSNY